jgi:1-acyl-sn-glycerol-3-phosphate acyltransferase
VTVETVPTPDPAPTTGRRHPFARLERLATGRSGLLLVGAWAFAEAIIWPIVPDLVIGLLALVAPRSVPRLFAALVIGALLGTAVLYALATVAPDAVASMLLALPGIPPEMLDAARAQVAGGDPVSIALVGPGTPLKVYTWAWAAGPATPAALAVGVVLNRITRIALPLVALTIVGLVAPSFLRRHDRLVLAAYAAFYVGAYAVYWR